LQIFDFTRLAQALNGVDLTTICLHSERQTAASDLAIDPHRASAADTMLATEVRAFES
jgi:hypothetical protein